MSAIIQLDSAAYKRHAIHGEDRCWAETNCYVDVLVELIHSLGFDPVAALAFTVAIDFEIDQWTFFKYSHHDLLTMYGMHVEELNPWKSLAEHINEQIDAGRVVLVEVDSYYLPDTVGSAYKTAHVKSTIAVNEIDIDANSLGYFHGQGYYQVNGNDFRELFQIDGLAHDRMLPPYIELVKLLSKPSEIDQRRLIDHSLQSLRQQVSLLPRINPFITFKKRFLKDLEWLKAEPLDTFHIYSFATLRQYGACFELVETYLKWLVTKGETGLEECIHSYKEISESAKIFQFKMARSLARNKELDLTPLETMTDHWQIASDQLKQKYL